MARRDGSGWQGWQEAVEQRKVMYGKGERRQMRNTLTHFGIAATFLTLTGPLRRPRPN